MWMPLRLTFNMISAFLIFLTLPFAELTSSLSILPLSLSIGGCTSTHKKNKILDVLAVIYIYKCSHSSILD